MVWCGGAEQFLYSESFYKAVRSQNEEYKMSVENLKASKANLAKGISNVLDISDGKKDKKISASVWNKFVKDKGGKKIKYSISLENAMKSISVYLERESKRTGKSKEDLAVKWFMGAEDKINKPASNELVPLPKGLQTDTSTNLSTNIGTPTAQQIKNNADSVTKFINGKSEGFVLPNAETAAQVLHQVIKNFNGKVPLKFSTHLFLMKLYPVLAKQAKALGIDAPAEVSHSQNASMSEVCKENLQACVALKNQILAAQKRKTENK